MKDITTKLTIIGAGPSGATLALFLAKNKIPHILIDQEIFPRDKICGDGFTVEVLRVLRELSEDLYQEFISADWVCPSNGSYIELANGKKLLLDYADLMDESAIFYVAKREIFDHWLISKLNPDYTESYFGCKVEKIIREGNLLKLTCKKGTEIFEITTNLLIGADGERSIVRKTFHRDGIKKNREHHCASIRCYYKGIEKKFANNPLELYQPSIKYKCYFWIFHLPNGEANVGIGALSSDVAHQKINLQHEMLQFISNHPDLKIRFKNAEALESPKGWGIPLNSDAKEYTGDNYLLIGDSAKFVEPVTGKGIGVAMFAASLAIPTIKNALGANSFTKKDLFPYEETIEKKFRKEWNTLYTWQNRMHKKNLISFLFTIFKWNPIKNYFKKQYTNNFKKFVSKPLENKI